MKDLGNKEIFAKNLRRYIEKTGKTQKQLAEIVGVAHSTFNDWATAKKYPRIDKIEILANYFGILKSDLIEEKREEKILTEEKEKDNEILSDIIVRMNTDADFRAAVESIYTLDASKVKGVGEMLRAFAK